MRSGGFELGAGDAPAQFAQALVRDRNPFAVAVVVDMTPGRKLDKKLGTYVQENCGPAQRYAFAHDPTHLP
jgi:hypothetical protein